MEDRTNVSNQGGQGQGNKPGQQGGGREGQGGNKPGQESGGREGAGGVSDKPSTRPTPSGVPNEGRQGGYKGGRQETGGIPNPDDRDDNTSAGSFRGIHSK